MVSSSSSVISLDAAGAAQPAVAQHGDPVGELAHLGQAVGDVDDRGALGDGLADQRRRAGRPRRRPAGRSARREPAARAGAAKALAISSRCFSARVRVSTRSLQVGLEADAGRAARAPTFGSDRRRTPTRAARPGGSPGPSGPAARPGAGARSRCPSSAACRGSRAVTPRPARRSSRVGLHGAGGDAHQRGLAGAVLAEDGVHLARGDLDGDVGQRGRRRRSAWRSPAGTGCSR